MILQQQKGRSSFKAITMKKGLLISFFSYKKFFFIYWAMEKYNFQDDQESKFDWWLVIVLQQKTSTLERS